MKIFFDGGCRPNPGEMETAVVAGGRAYVRRGIGPGSSGEAEWAALLHALEVARTLGARDVVLAGDALNVVQAANGTGKCRGAAALSCLAAFRAEAAAFDRVRVRHVARTQNLAGIALARDQGVLARDQGAAGRGLGASSAGKAARS